MQDNLPPLPWEVSKPAHGKRITLLPDIEVSVRPLRKPIMHPMTSQEPMPTFDIIDDRFGEPLPAPPVTAMDIDERYDRTFFRAASEDRDAELLRGNFFCALFSL